MNEIATLQPAEAGVPLNARQLLARLAVIQDVMKNVMKIDQDYGVIPGTEKPTLYKPGAEKLCVTFRLSAGAPIIDLITELAGDIRYRVQVPIIASDGTVLAVGVGECSTGEEKYKWRRPVHVNEYTAAADDQRREKWQRNGDVWQQVRVNPSDVANTVLKMAHKRAYVHAAIMATAAGAIFTQDIEDLPDGVAQEEQDQRRPPIQPPQRKAVTPPSGSGTATTIGVRGVTEKKGVNDKGEWTLYGVVGSDGKTYKTFDAEIASMARQAAKDKSNLEVTYTESKFGRDIQGCAHADREVGAEG
jgi:hypothetical protein